MRRAGPCPPWAARLTFEHTRGTVGHDLHSGTPRPLADRRRIACGIATAITLWAALSVAGLAFVLSRVAMLYDLVRLAGAAFLVYLGIRMLVSTWRGRPGQRRCLLPPSGDRSSAVS
ncbi:LysE family translocator [Salinisphaera sp.]|uniref:LysE family translocator n=1 Tax=Salinisphaera sp. TaxID=1914330 RepID=UPI003C79B277